MLTKEMRREWKAWRDICSELEKIGIDINNEDALCKAIQNWGACLFFLRLSEGK